MPFSRGVVAGYVLQNDRRMRAALSLSLSRVVGQKASLPMRLEKRLTGAPSLSAQPQTLSNPCLLFVFVVSHDGSLDVTFSMADVFVWKEVMY